LQRDGDEDAQQAEDLRLRLRVHAHEQIAEAQQAETGSERQERTDEYEHGAGDIEHDIEIHRPLPPLNPVPSMMPVSSGTWPCPVSSSASTASPLGIFASDAASAASGDRSCRD